MTTTTPSTSGSFLGHSVKRTEDRGLVTGAEHYTADLQRTDALHAVFVRSPFAHGTLEGVDVAGARGRPGVVAVHTAADLDLPDRPGLPGVVPDCMARPHLARGKVRFVGDIVAVVIADSVPAALDAAEDVLAEIEPLPAVTGIEEALADDAPLLYEENGSNLITGAGTGEGRAGSAAFPSGRGAPGPPGLLGSGGGEEGREGVPVPVDPHPGSVGTPPQKEQQVGGGALDRPGAVAA